jgi:hypothetical protein
MPAVGVEGDDRGAAGEVVPGRQRLLVPEGAGQVHVPDPVVLLAEPAEGGQRIVRGAVIDEDDLVRFAQPVGRPAEHGAEGLQPVGLVADGHDEAEGHGRYVARFRVGHHCLSRAGLAGRQQTNR